MAIFSKILIASGLVAFVAARPLVVAKRDMATVTETTWSTVDVVETLWVNSDGTPVSTGSPGVFAQQPAASTTMQAAPTTPAAIVSTPTIAAQVQSYTPQAAATTTPMMTTTPAVPAYTPSTTAAVAAAAASPASGSSSSGGSSGSTGGIASGSSTATCEGEGNACQGDITHWDGGLGACGWNVDTNSDMQIALPFAFMGTQSNGNPYCGKSLTIQNPNTGATVQATVGDKCMGCTGRSIDLTDALFNAVDPSCNGRCSGFNWWFN